MSRWTRHPEAVAQTDESLKVSEEGISSTVFTLGRNDVPHIYVTRDGRAFLRVHGRRVSFDLAMSPAQLRSVQRQAERVLHAYDLRDSA